MSQSSNPAQAQLFEEVHQHKPLQAGSSWTTILSRTSLLTDDNGACMPAIIPLDDCCTTCLMLVDILAPRAQTDCAASMILVTFHVAAQDQLGVAVWPHYEILKYYQSAGKERAQVLRDLIVARSYQDGALQSVSLLLIAIQLPHDDTCTICLTQLLETCALPDFATLDIPVTFHIAAQDHSDLRGVPHMNSCALQSVDLLLIAWDQACAQLERAEAFYEKIGGVKRPTHRLRCCGNVGKPGSGRNPAKYSSGVC